MRINLLFNKLFCQYLLLLKRLLAVLMLLAGIPAQAQFRAAVVTVDITPDSPKMLLGYSARQSTGVHDPIKHRIVVMDDGFKKFVLVSSDICVMSPSQYDHTAAFLQQQLQISPEQFWWSLTHTHSAPEVGVPGLPESFMGERYKHDVDTAYTSFVERTLVDGVASALKQLEPASLGVGWGFSQANMNRRAVDASGTASLGMNPDAPVDRRIGLLRLSGTDGKPIALIANYPIHGTLYGADNLEISGDVPGIVSNYVEKKLGAPLLFINGAAGNLAPLYSVSKKVYGSKESELDQMCVFLGDKIMEANRNIGTAVSDIRLFTGQLVIETPMKEGLKWPNDLKNYTRTTANAKRLIRLPARFLRINEDIAIWSLPVELFCEISNEIRDRSPYPYTFYYGYTNGWLGYLPSDNEWKYGGYEIDVVCPYTPVVGRKVTESVLGYLEGELKSKNRENQW